MASLGLLAMRRVLLPAVRRLPQLQQGARPQVQSVSVPCLRMSSSGPVESDAEFDARYIAFFERPDIDGWEIRKALNDLSGMDLVPEPAVYIAAFKAARRLNDFALTVRMLEVVKYKSGSNYEQIWAYLMQELKPTMDELGISTPEELGYDKPELFMPDPYRP